MSELEELPSWAGRSVSSTSGGDPVDSAETEAEAAAAATGNYQPVTEQTDQAAAPAVQPQYAERRRRPLTMFLIGFLGLVALVGVGAIGYLLAQSQDSSETEASTDAAEDSGQLASEASGDSSDDDAAATTDADADADTTAADGGSQQLTVETDDGEGATADEDASGSDDGTSGDEDSAGDGTDGSTGDQADGTAAEAENDREAFFRGGKVYLTGSVPSEEVGQFIEQRAAAVVGPDNVVNEYVIDPTVVIEEGSSAPLYVEDVVLFEFNSVEVAQPFLPILDLGTLLLRQNPQASITVVTRTDAVGSEEVNLDVSTKRAQAVINYWLSKGVNRDQIIADPRGEEGASESDDEETAALSRRAEFIITGLLD